MKCTSCNAETNGVKINGKLFCSNCGDLLATPEVALAAEPVASARDDKRIDTGAEETEKNLNFLEAEEKVFEVIENLNENIGKAEPAAPLVPTPEPKKNRPKKTVQKKKVIIKHNRGRADRKRWEKDFLLVSNEPDPIAEPELTAPGEELLEVPKEVRPKVPAEEIKFDLVAKDKEINYPLVDSKKKKEIEDKRKRHQEIFTNFLKQSASRASENKKKKIKKTKRHSKIIWFGSVILLVVFGLGGYALYMYYQNLPAEPAVMKVESGLSFTANRPRYVPAGYELSFRTSGDVDSITYQYFYAPNRKKTLSVRISKSNISNQNIYQNVVEPKEGYYTMQISDNIDYWFVGDNSLYFASNNLLYEIVSSDKMPKEELLKISDGLK